MDVNIVNDHGKDHEPDHHHHDDLAVDSEAVSENGPPPNPLYNAPPPPSPPPHPPSQAPSSRNVSGVTNAIGMGPDVVNGHSDSVFNRVMHVDGGDRAGEGDNVTYPSATSLDGNDSVNDAAAADAADAISTESLMAAATEATGTVATDVHHSHHANLAGHARAIDSAQAMHHGFHAEQGVSGFGANEAVANEEMNSAVVYVADPMEAARHEQIQQRQEQYQEQQRQQQLPMQPVQEMQQMQRGHPLQKVEPTNQMQEQSEAILETNQTAGNVTMTSDQSTDKSQPAQPNENNDTSSAISSTTNFVCAAGKYCRVPQVPLQITPQLSHNNAKTHAQNDQSHLENHAHDTGENDGDNCNDQLREVNANTTIFTTSPPNPLENIMTSEEGDTITLAAANTKSNENATSETTATATMARVTTMTTPTTATTANTTAICIECQLPFHGTPYCGIEFANQISGPGRIHAHELQNFHHHQQQQHHHHHHGDKSLENEGGVLCWLCVQKIHDRRDSSLTVPARAVVTLPASVAVDELQNGLNPNREDVRNQQSKVKNNDRNGRKGQSELKEPPFKKQKVIKVSNGGGNGQAKYEITLSTNNGDAQNASSSATASTLEQNTAPRRQQREQDPKKDVGTSSFSAIVTNSNTNPPSSSSKNRKDRTEFTTAQKLEILAELTGPSPQHRPTIQTICRKYGVSKSSLFRWKTPQMHLRLKEMMNDEQKGSKKRDVKDPFEKVKIELQEFVEDNERKPLEERMIITTAVIQARGTMIKNDLLEKYERGEVDLSKEEVVGLKGFKATKSWAGKNANQMGWLTHMKTCRKDACVEGGGDIGDDSGGGGELSASKDNVECHEMQPTDNGDGFSDGEDENGNKDAGSGEDKLKSVKETIPTTEKTIPLETVMNPVAPGIPPVQDATADENIEEQKQTAAIDKARQNTLRFLYTALPNNQFAPKPKKDRREFTCQEKIAILEELSHPSNTLTVDQICKKYDTSKSSLFRWKAQYKNNQLQEMVANAGHGQHKRLKLKDNLSEIKSHLKEFIELNSSNSIPMDKRIGINNTVLQQEAMRYRDELLARHDRSPFLAEEEVAALGSFKASKAWIRKVASHWDFKRDNGSFGYMGAMKPVVVHHGNNHPDIPIESSHVIFEGGNEHEISMEDNMDGTNCPQTLEEARKEEQHPHLAGQHNQHVHEHQPLEEPGEEAHQQHPSPPTRHQQDHEESIEVNEERYHPQLSHPNHHQQEHQELGEARGEEEHPQQPDHLTRHQHNCGQSAESKEEVHGPQHHQDHHGGCDSMSEERQHVQHLDPQNHHEHQHQGLEEVRHEDQHSQLPDQHIMMDDYVKEMAEEAVDATMKMVGDIRNKMKRDNILIARGHATNDVHQQQHHVEDTTHAVDSAQHTDNVHVVMAQQVDELAHASDHMAQHHHAGDDVQLGVAIQDQHDA